MRKKYQIDKWNTSMGEELRSGFVQSNQNFRLFKDRALPYTEVALSGTLPQNLRGVVVKPGVLVAGTTGYAVSSNSSPAQIFTSAGVLTNTTWTAAVNFVDAVAATIAPPITIYKDYLVGLSSRPRAWKYGPLSGVPTLNETDWVTGITGAAPTVPLVYHPVDSALYLFVNNQISRAGDIGGSGDFIADVFDVPASATITAACSYGQYLAVATVDNASAAYVNLFDILGTTANTAKPVYSYYCGSGRVKALGEIDGQLMVVMFSSVTQNLVIKRLSGTYMKTVNSIESTTNVDNLNVTNGNGYFSNITQLFFPITLQQRGTYYVGIASVDSSGAIALDQVKPTSTNDSQDYATSVVKVGDYIFSTWDFSSSSGNSRIYYNTQTTYGTSVFESGIYGLKYNESQLVGAYVTFDKLTTGQSVKLSYKKADETTWTDLKTEATVGSRRLSYPSFNPTPTCYEYQWKITSVGGAILSGLQWVTEEQDTKATL